MVMNINWMALALLAASCWGVVNVLDKAMLENRIVKIKTRQFIDSGIGLLIASSLLWKLSSPSLLLIFLGILSGILIFAFNFHYYHALRQADVSAISVYLQLIPVFSALIGFVFFVERFHADIYLGALLIILGAVVVAIERTTKWGFTIFLGKNMLVLLKFILPASVMMSITYGLTKLLLAQYSFWEVFFWGRIGFFSAGIFFYVMIRKNRIEINENIKLIGFRKIYSVALIECLNFLGILLLTAAYATGTITLVSTVAAIQPLIVIVMLVSIAVIKDSEPLKDFSSSKIILFIRMAAVFSQVIGIFLLS